MCLAKQKMLKHDFSLIVIEGRCVSTAAAIIITNTDIPAVNEPSCIFTTTAAEIC
jgi:uncharacterized membrane protein YdfJ with MMPL/SSD domain